MDNLEVLKVLTDNGVKDLVHANSVRTSCTYLTEGALLSRECVEKNGLAQTPQYTDAADKKYGIWNDIFLDTIDIHYRARRKNHYGPVLFQFNPNSVLSDKRLGGTLRITRMNPSNWHDGQSGSDRYFQSARDFAQEFRYGTFGTHLTFRLRDGRLPFDNYLKGIVLDDPQIAGKTDFFETAHTALIAAAKKGKVEAKIVKRECRDECTCLGTYKAQWHDLKVMFIL
jgi:hypothetical protein